MSTTGPGQGIYGRGPGPGANPRPAHRDLTGDTRTGHGELKLESGEWEAADKAISRALHRAPVSSSCSINLILRASLPPPRCLSPQSGRAEVRLAAPGYAQGQWVVSSVTPEELTENTRSCPSFTV